MRGAKFYHACQLKDFRTYLEFGGIPCRERLEDSGLPYTLFATDDADRRSGSSSKVFGNLSDFGFSFAASEWKRENTAPVPNPYGPILLELRPDALREADDVAICLRSAGGNDFDREAESLSTAEQVARLFANDYDPNQQYSNAYIKFSEGLRREFPDRVKPATVAGWTTINPEVSCTVKTGCLSFSELSRIVVDQYELDGVRLIDLVRLDLRNFGLQAGIQSRWYRGDMGRQQILSDLARVLSAGPANVNEFLAIADLSEQSASWGRRVVRGNLSWLFERFARYLRTGTLAEMR